MRNLYWHHRADVVAAGGRKQANSKKPKVVKMCRIAAIILLCTIVSLLGTAHTTTNTSRDNIIPASVTFSLDTDSMDMIANANSNDSLSAMHSAPAGTIHVDVCPSVSGPFLTVSGAVAVASPGETIDIQCGVYPESLLIDKELTLSASGGPVIIGGQIDRLWAGTNNGDIFDEPVIADDPDKTLGAMLDELVTANIKVLRILIDYRLELADDDYDGDDNADALPVGEYNDDILSEIDDLMVEAKQRGILLLIALQGSNWINAPYYMSREFYGWRQCKTPTDLYTLLADDPAWGCGSFESPYQQRARKANPPWGNYLTEEEAKNAYKQRVSHILHHRNPHFGNLKWKDINDVIWAWELMNEPEHLDTGRVDILIPWLEEMSAYVKGIDPDTYLALGTYSLLHHHFVHVDIYTVHAYPSIGSLETDIGEFNSPTGVGGKYDKLLFVEEFTPYRNWPWVPVSLNYQSDLEAEELSLDFRQELESRDVTLSNNLSIETIAKGCQWRVIDNDRGMSYFVENRGYELQFYKEQDKAYSNSAFLDRIRPVESADTPWMWWEYGYNTEPPDEDDVWHSGIDASLWNQVIVPHVTNMWNTQRPCACKLWRVGEMVDALNPPQTPPPPPMPTPTPICIDGDEKNETCCCVNGRLGWQQYICIDGSWEEIGPCRANIP